MPGLKLFDVGGDKAVEIAARTAMVESDLQRLVEANMEAMLGVRFLASEYSTGPLHGGRIDSLGVDENGSPVIIEYKRGKDAGVISQGLFYLAWLTDHRAEFQHLVHERLGAAAAAQVTWAAPRLICIAEEFTRYDVHAVREMRRTIDLVRYRYFGDNLLALESVVSTACPDPRLRPLLKQRELASGRATAELRVAVDEVLTALGDDVTPVDRKQYRAYRRLRNFACVGSTQQREVVLYLSVNPSEVDLVPGFTRDVTGIGHHGTGSLEVRLRSEKDLERARNLFQLGYSAA
ncbi:transporter [Streptomyces sp. NPDC050418]|uniref:transporter n=1 Tax=Streptomyces sp. NPDC050418 TaxID=3365612 RepID=UPI0037BBA0DB